MWDFFDEEYATSAYSSLSSPLFELPLIIKVQKAGFQNREDEALLEEGGSASVRVWYTRPGLSKFALYSMSNMLRQHIPRYQSPLFELPLIRNA